MLSYYYMLCSFTIFVLVLILVKVLLYSLWTYIYPPGFHLVFELRPTGSLVLCLVGELAPSALPLDSPERNSIVYD